MREILFRAKRVDNGEWVEGYLFDDGMAEAEHYFVGRIVVEPYKGTACDDWDITGIDFCEVNPETLCQYTGLKDKNGNRIWENDIAKCNKRKDGFELYKVLWRKCYADFGVEPLEFGVQYPISLGENEQDIKGCNYEVVGNIFDNPELMKEQ